ncbi:hypothetical protein O6486_24745, partial [Salmonella enterica subsp. enterica]
MSERTLVAMNAVDVGSEHEVELFGGRQEGLEVDRILFVPENRGYLVVFAPFKDVLQFVAVMADFAAPQVIFAAPG